jgi:hypothetical protein
LGRITPNSLSSDIDFEGIHLQLNTNE